MDYSDASSFREELIEGQQKSSVTSGYKFKVIRFDLSVARSRYDVGVTDHTFGSGIKSFWVCDTNNSSFTAKIIPNYRNDRDKYSGLPLKYNMNQKFKYPVNDACLEFSAQPGVWIDIAFSESEDIEVGSTAITLNGNVEIDKGSSYTMAKYTGNGTAQMLLPADSTRKNAIIQVKAGNILVGKNTDLADPDASNLCLSLGENSVTDWGSKGALYFLGGAGDVVHVTIFKV